MMGSNAFKRTVKKLQALKAFDNVTSTSLLQLIHKNPERRTRREIDLFLPTLMKKTDCLRNVERDVAAEILRHSEHENYSRGDVIIKQGEEGNRFYIVIRGSVGVYVREIPKKHRKRKAIVVRLPRITSESNTSHQTGENTHFPGCPARHGVLNHHQEVPHDFCHVSDDDDNHMKELETQYGPKVNVLPAGHSFGEIALLDTDVRNASVIAEDDVDLLVISRRLFENTIKGFQSKELDGKRTFVRTHPFFTKWTESEQENIIASMTKRVFRAGTCAFRQASDVTALHFLVKGKACLSANPDLHRKQFPARFEAAMLSKKHPIQFEHQMRKGVKLPSISVSKNSQEISCVKRMSGLSVPDRFVASRRVNLCYIQEGEIVHDLEFLLNLRTSLFRVFCATECEFYSLDEKQIDRFIMDRNGSAFMLLKTRAETKLNSRISSKEGKKLDILPLLLLQLRFVRILKEKGFDNESIRVHRLPLSECLHISGHEFHEYDPQESGPDQEVVTKSGVPKYVLEGPDFYRKLVRKRQKEMEEIRRRYPSQVHECQSISNEMKDMILNNVKQRQLVEKIMKKYSFGWEAETSWLTR